MFEFVIFVRNIQNIKRRISNLNLKNESIFKVSSTWKSYFRKVQSLLQLDLYFTTLQGTTHLTCNFRLKKTHKLIHFGQKPKNICHLFFVKKFLIGCQAGQSGLSSGGTYLQLVFHIVLNPMYISQRKAGAGIVQVLYRIVIGHHRILSSHWLTNWRAVYRLNRRTGILKKMPGSFSYECRF